MHTRDFTFEKYKELCKVIKKSGYVTFTMKDYFLENKKKNLEDIHFILMRHDVDNKVDHPFVLEMAKFESSIGINSTYYFRTVSNVFNENLIAEISKLGHEIGYHYEVLNESGGDFSKGIEIFKSNLEKMRRICPVETISQHGGSLGDLTATTFLDLLKTGMTLAFKKTEIASYESKKIWEKYSFEDFGISGEAYLSLDFNKIIYFSDTGIKWDAFKNRVHDSVNTSYYTSKGRLIRTTDDLIEIVAKKKIKQMCILTHPPNWRDPCFSWVKWHFLQQFRNFGKDMYLSVK